MKEVRTGKVIINKSGGTASANGVTYRITIPSKWIHELGVDADNRSVTLRLDGQSITITKA